MPTNLPLPSFELQPGHPLSNAALACGLGRFEDVARFIHALPYGRNTDRAAFARVLDEGRGTCSTKHAFLAALAGEHGVALELRVGLYEMEEGNTQGVGTALDAARLACVPEAHCYLFHAGHRVDLTHPGTTGECLVQFLDEVTIVPAEIGARKVEVHRAFLRKWAAARGLSFDHAWQAREACIAALGARGVP